MPIVSYDPRAKMTPSTGPGREKKPSPNRVKGPYPFRVFSNFLLSLSYFFFLISWYI